MGLTIQHANDQNKEYYNTMADLVLDFIKAIYKNEFFELKIEAD